MSVIEANLYDGLTSKSHHVFIKLDTTITVSKENIYCPYSLDEVEFSSRVGNSSRYLYLPYGMKCETLQNDEVDAFLKQHSLQRLPRMLNIIKSKAQYVAIALVLFLLFSFGFLSYGIPSLSYYVAGMTPYSTKERLSDAVLSQMNNVYVYQSRLPIKRQESIQKKFHEALNTLHLEHPKYTLHIKSSNVGPNAFALPSGDIVLTDELINMAKNDDEILSVLLHEVGHVELNHGFQSIYRNSTTFLFTSFLTADISQITVLGASLPTFFLSNQYSREFEYEADHYFKDNAKKLNIDAHALGDLLQRISKSDIQGIFSYFSTHPSTKDRVKNIQ